ncbi:MAG: SRPBCC family protein [Myxococcales bacterium]|nr:SRPBCC family protein [Myxococcales bacterium]
MRKMSLTLLVMVALLLPSLVLADPPEPHIPSLSAEQVDRLNNGEILVEVVNGDVPIGDVLGVVDAPAQQVLDIIVDFDSWHEFMPSMTETEVTSTEGEYYICRAVTDTPWPMDDRVYSFRAWAGETEVDGMTVLTSNWDYVEGSGNLEDTEGYWLLIPWGEDGSKTLVRYYLTADLGTWLPDFLLNWGTENMLPSLIEGLRSRAS